MCRRRVVAKHIPTKIGDVLILWTDASFTVYSVGHVFVDGQQDFAAQKNVRHERDRATAVAVAKTLVVPGRRVFIRNIDSDEWSEI
jgi:hypothetical protein